MKLLVLDFWFGKTHQRTNKRTIEILSKVTDLLVTNFNGYYERTETEDNIEYIEVKCHNQPTNKVRQRFRSMYNIFESWRAIKERTDYDAILVTGYEVISVAFMFLLYRTSKPIFLQYHQHVDEVGTRVKRLFFNSYKNRAHHIFLEESFADYFLKITHVDESRIHIVHHFIMDRINDGNDGGNLILGISSSNDESMIERMIREEQEKHVLKDSGLRMHLRSRLYVFNDDYLKVDNEYLSAGEYKELFDSAGMVLVIPRKEEFEHRVSGLIYDALSSKKKVLGVDIEIMQIMNHYAPTMFYIIKDGENVIEAVRKCAGNRITEKDLKTIRERHSDDRIEDDYKKMFKKVIGKEE